jgi:alkanesulfonate monooxygenase SsuD/methylene tetrahydromethanopterin reductase-like flavin-dependent oxidoreductase (luciferase family)
LSRTTVLRSPPRRSPAVAVAAEGAGFESAWVTDHLIVPDEYAGIYVTIAEALVSVGFLTGRTQRLELGSRRSSFRSAIHSWL